MILIFQFVLFYSILCGRPKIGIISRRKKRFILNEFEMADIAMSYGFEVVLLPLETMTYYEQVCEGKVSEWVSQSLLM